MKVYTDLNELSIAAANYIIAISNEAIGEKGKFTISLSGGNTPEKLYSILAQSPYREQIQWENTFVFWGDERCVPFDDSRNNAYQAKLVLLNKVPIPPANIYRIPVNLPPAKASAVYGREMKDFFGEAPVCFDAMLLGLGENGHTASLFPGTNVLAEEEAGIRGIYVEEEKMYRITMTAPLINQAHRILFLVSGKNKADVLPKIISGPYDPEEYPAQLIKPIGGELRWFVDDDAASHIKQNKLNPL